MESIKNGVECGIQLDSSVEPQPGDTIVCYEVVEKPQQLQWNLSFLTLFTFIKCYLSSVILLRNKLYSRQHATNLFEIFYLNIYVFGKQIISHKYPPSLVSKSFPKNITL